MISRTVVVFGLLALLACLLAIAAGSNASIALPAAAAAVVFGGVLLIEMLDQTRWDRATAGPRFATDPSRIRSAFLAGVHGRPALIAALDSLERTSGHPNRPMTSVEELDRLRALPSREFHAYLDRRVRELEARS